MDPQDRDFFQKFVPIYKSVFYGIGLAVLAPLALKKLGNLADSDISFTYNIYQFIKK